jgi:hypothetical protein
MLTHCFGPLPVVPEAVLAVARAIMIVSLVVFTYVSLGEYLNLWVDCFFRVHLLAVLAVAVLLLAGGLSHHPCIDHAGNYLVCAVAIVDVCALGALVFRVLTSLFGNDRDAKEDEADDV